MDAALAHLRLQGIRVLNYLDDWLILAHSKAASESSQGYRSRPHPFSWPQDERQEECAPPISANRVSRGLFGFRSDAGRLAPARIADLTACLARFKLGHHVSVGTCRRLLGLMAAASPVLTLGLLHMRLFLWWMKELRLHPTVPATRLIRCRAVAVDPF